MNHKLFKMAAGLILVLTCLFFFYPLPDEAVHAFNQSNLVRVTEVQEVDGQIFFRRLAPVAGRHP